VESWSHKHSFNCWRLTSVKISSLPRMKVQSARFFIWHTSRLGIAYVHCLLVTVDSRTKRLDSRVYSLMRMQMGAVFCFCFFRAPWAVGFEKQVNFNEEESSWVKPTAAVSRMELPGNNTLVQTTVQHAVQAVAVYRAHDRRKRGLWHKILICIESGSDCREY